MFRLHFNALLFLSAGDEALIRIDFLERGRQLKGVTF